MICPARGRGREGEGAAGDLSRRVVAERDLLAVAPHARLERLARVGGHGAADALEARRGVGRQQPQPLALRLGRGLVARAHQLGGRGARRRPARETSRELEPPLRSSLVCQGARVGQPRLLCGRKRAERALLAVEEHARDVRLQLPLHDRDALEARRVVRPDGNDARVLGGGRPLPLLKPRPVGGGIRLGLVVGARALVGVAGRVVVAARNPLLVAPRRVGVLVRGGRRLRRGRRLHLRLDEHRGGERRAEPLEERRVDARDGAQRRSGH